MPRTRPPRARFGARSRPASGASGLPPGVRVVRATRPRRGAVASGVVPPVSLGPSGASGRRVRRLERRVGRLERELGRERGGYGPVQQIAYGPGGGGLGGGGGASALATSGGHGGGEVSPYAHETRPIVGPEPEDVIAQRIKAARMAGMSEEKILSIALGEREAKKESKSGTAKFAEGASNIGAGLMSSIFNPIIYGNLLLIIILVLLMWIVLQFFGMVG